MSKALFPEPPSALLKSTTMPIRAVGLEFCIGRCWPVCTDMRKEDTGRQS